MPSIGLSLVDHSALPRWPHLIKALAQMHRDIDEHWAIRQVMGSAIVPSRVQVHPLGGALVLLVTLG